MINRFRLFMKGWVFLISLLAFASTQANTNTPSVPAYYTADMQAAPATFPTTTRSTTQTTTTTTTAQPTVAERNYIELRAMLPLYQNAAASPWPAIPDYARFKAGKRGQLVMLVRNRLKLTGDLDFDNSSDKYDASLIGAVKSFQDRHGLKADGVIGKDTRAELNVLPEERIKQIQVNIQRWEALSHKLGHRFIMVNVPDYRLYLVEDDKQILSMKTIIGKPTRQTPEVFSKITTIVFKPYWNVPATIARKDIATKAMQDPAYLDKNNIHVYDNEDSRNEIDDRDINWESVAENGSDLHFRQDPGEKNSLGLVKFEFPNPYDVYLHDTPAKALFAEDKRAFSSGCVRLERPFDLVAYLMKDNPDWNDEHMDMLLTEDKPTYVNVEKPLRVVITYITAWVDANGKVNFRDDIYGRDSDPNNENEPNNTPEAP